MKFDYDVAIIGAGPAGITASIYLTRAEVSCCLIEKEMPGGQVNKTSTVENYPGFTKIAGPDLVMKFVDQINDLGIKQIYNEVTSIENSDDKKVIKFTNGETLTVKQIILALGRRPKRLENSHFSELEGKGISFCSLCDGYLYKNQDVSIIGAGNSALEESLYLADICKSVTILCRSEYLKGDNTLIDKVKERDNIRVIYNSKVVDFNEKDGVLDSVSVDEDGLLEDLKTSACFVFIGYEPATNFLKTLDILDEKGYIIVDEKKRTSIKGIYAAGDAVFKDAFQIVTAVSDGAEAAVSCIKDAKEVQDEVK